MVRFLAEMALSGNQLITLHRALCSAFPNPAALAARGLDAELLPVPPRVGQGGPVYELIIWADANRQLDSLLQAALELAPHHRELRGYCARYGPAPPPPVEPVEPEPASPRDEAIGALLVALAPSVYAHIRATFPNPTIAEDLLSQALSQAFSSRQQLRVEDDETALAENTRRWLFAITRNVVRDELRRVRRQSTHVRAAPLHEEDATVSLDLPGSSLLEGYMRFLTRLAQADTRPNAAFRAYCAYLVRIQGCTYDETVDLLLQEAPHLLAGRSEQPASRRSRVQAAVSRVDKEFRKWYEASSCEP